jgi:DNA polymerase-3 subunit epsilon
MLMEEFARVGMDLDMSKRRAIDVQRIFYKMEPRTLKAALKFYCDKELNDAHDAMADVRATIDVFFGQLQRYENADYVDDQGAVLPNPVAPDVQALHDFTNDQKYADATQRLRYDVDGVVVFNFGKYNGQPVAETLANDKQYYNWIMNKEFSTQVKQMVKQLVRDYDKAQRNEQ